MYDFVREINIKTNDRELYLGQVKTNGALLAYIQTKYGTTEKRRKRKKEDINELKITIMDISTNEIVKTIEFTSSHDAEIYDFNGDNIVILDYGTETVNVINIITEETVLIKDIKYGKNLNYQNFYISNEYLVGLYIDRNKDVDDWVPDHRKEKTIVVWELSQIPTKQKFKLSGRTTLTLKGHELLIHQPNLVEIWDLRSNKLIVEFEGSELNPQDEPEDDDFFEYKKIHNDFNNKYIVTYSNDGIKLWNREGKLLTLKRKMNCEQFDVLRLDGDNLIIKCNQEPIVIVDIMTGKIIQQIDNVPKGEVYTMYNSGTIISIDEEDYKNQTDIYIWSRRRGRWLKDMLKVGKHWGEEDSVYSKNINAIFKQFGKDKWQGGGYQYGGCDSIDSYDENDDENDDEICDNCRHSMEGGDNMLKHIFKKKKLSPKKQQKLQAVKNCKTFFASESAKKQFDKVYSEEGEEGAYKFCKKLGLIMGELPDDFLQDL
jgi:hypothetical protein